MKSFYLFLCLAVLPAPLLAQSMPSAPDVIGAIRAGDWMGADAAAAREADPVARKLVLFYRLLTPEAATAGEIAQFIVANPDWPLQAQLARSRDRAVQDEPDDAAAAALCAQYPPVLPEALLRCAVAEANSGKPGPAAAAARQAWLTGLDDAAMEASFLPRWGSVITAADQWRRFERLTRVSAAAAARQALRLDPAHAAIATAWIALHQNDPAAPALLAGLSPEAARTPVLFLEQARYLRRMDQDADALALWRAAGAAVEHGADAGWQAVFWAERERLARHRLRDGDAEGAYFLADDAAITAVEPALDAAFLAGFIALRRLHEPARAAEHFAALARLSNAVITQARAHYWLARSATTEAEQRAEYAAAAAYPTTFYGQLASLALGDAPAALNARILALHDPRWSTAQAVDFTAREVARAAAALIAWGAPQRARPFLLRLVVIGPDASDRSLVAHLALGLGMPDKAVAIARGAGRAGVMLPDAGWPLAAEVPQGPVDPAVALGLIRQESSFDSTAISPAGARGLMQLMPATAQRVARELGALPLRGLTTDAAYNVLLGTAYLRGVLDQFGGALPLALAAYNAGPANVQRWLGENGDPRLVGVDPIDWIELIPFAETRNYVQRVIENIAIYRAKRQEIAPYPLRMAAP